MQHTRSSSVEFTGSTKMCDIIHTNYHLLSVINNFGIKLGFGDKTIEAVCLKHGIDPDFFLTIANTYTNPNYELSDEQLEFNPEHLVTYLQNTHRYYITAILPALKSLINQLTVSNNQSTQSTLIQRFHEEYIKDLTNHILFEEQVVFPYISELSKAYRSNRKEFNSQNSPFKIQNFKKKHSDVESKLFDLKNILIKYFTTCDDDLTTHILFLLFRFEKDLYEHSRLEDKVLIPRIRQIEESFNIR